MVVKIYIVVFWVMTPYSLAGYYQSFGQNYCLHIHNTGVQLYYTHSVIRQPVTYQDTFQLHKLSLKNTF
jgi:hypothetical protein